MAGVVVGVHRSVTAEAPVRWAADQARRRRLPLTLVHAWHEPVSVTVPLDPHDLPDLDQPAVTHAEPGRAVDVLLAQPADLLVLGGHSGTPHLRHATRMCVERATCPVAVIPEAAPKAPGRVVVGVDHTTMQAAFAWAADTAELFDVPLLAVNAWQWHPRATSDALHHRKSLLEQQEAAQQRLEEWVRVTSRRSIVAECRAVHGAPLDTFLRLLVDSDLLVVGRRSPHRLGRLTHGAVGEDLTALLPCPVVVVAAGPTSA